MAQGINIDLQLNPELNVSQLNVMLKQLKDSMGDLGKDIKLIDGEKLSNEFKKVNQEAGKTGTSFDGLNKTLGQSTQTASTFQKAFQFSVIQQSVVGLTSALSPMINEFIDLDKQIKNIGTLGRDDFEEFSAIALQMAADIPGSASDMANGIYQAISAGAKGTAQEIGAFVEVAAKAGVAGLSDTTTAVNGLTSVLNAYGKSYDDANEVADTFFAGIKLGKTSFSELNSSLASFIPSASAMEVGFDQATAAIARLTAVGTPTAQAGTQMNAAFTLLAKGTTPLIDSLKVVGTDLSTLREKLKQPVKDGGGLVNVFREIKTAADASGKQLAELTGSVEAAKIIESLAGSNEKYLASLSTFNDVTGEIAGGAALKAFDIASTSIASKADGLGATIQNALSGVFQSIGSDAVAGLSTLNQFAPALSGVAGAVGTFGGSITSAGSALLNFAKSPVAGVTSAVSKISGILPAAGNAFRVFWAAATGPVGLLIAGLAAAAVGVYFLVDALHVSAEERLEDAKAEEEIAKQQTALAEQQVATQEKRVSAATALRDEYERLGNQSNRTAEEEAKFLEIQNSLIQAYPGAISSTNSFQENLANLRGELDKDKEKLGEYTQAVRDAKVAEAEASATTANAQVGVDVEGLKDTLGDGLNDFFDTGFELRENKSMIDNIAKQFTEAANSNDVLLAKSNALSLITGSDDLTPEEKQESIDRVNALSDAKVAAIEADAEKIKVAYEQEISAINEQFQQNGVDFSIDDAKIQELSEQFGVPLEEVKAAVAGMEKEARQSKVGELLAESSKIQGDIKKITRLDDLVKAFNEAETESAKAKIGDVIKDIAPEVLKSTGVIEGANGELINTYEVLGGELDKVKAKQSEQYGGDLLAKQKQFVDVISEEGDKYRANRAELDKLKAEIDKGKRLNIDTSEAEAKFNKLSQENQKAIGEVVESTAKLAAQGEVSNEIYAELGREFGVSGEEMKKMVDNAKGLANSLEDSIKSVAELGDSFKAAMDGSKKIASDSQAALAEISRLEREGQIDREEAEKRKAQIVKDGKAAILETKKLTEDDIKAQKLLGVFKDTNKKKEKDIYDIIKAKYDLDTKALDQRQAQFELDNETLILDEKREKTIFDEILVQQSKNKVLEEQKKLLLEQFKLVENADGSVEFGINFKADQKEKINQEIHSLNQEIQKGSNSEIALRLKINKETAEIQKQLDEFSLRQLQMKIDIAVDDKSRQEAREALIKALQNGIDDSNKIITDTQSKINELTKTEAITGLSDAQTLALAKLKLQLNTQIGIVQDTNKRIADLNKASLTEQLDALKEKQDKELEAIEKGLTDQEELRNRLVNTTAAVATKALERQNTAVLAQLDSEKQARLDALSEIENNEELKTQLEAHFQAKRLQQEKDYQLQQKAIQAIQQGEILEATRQKDIALLEQQRSSLQARLDVLNTVENPDAATIQQIQELTTQLDGISTSLEEKSDKFAFIKEKLGAGLTDTFSALFQGNAEDMKAPFRESLQVVAGALKAQLSALVTKLVFDQLSIIPGVGLAGLLLAPILQGVIGSGLSAILNPILAGITSFSTGGRVDNPTLAIVGDASQSRAGSNTEWIFRDDQIALLMGLTAVSVANQIVPKLGKHFAGYQAQILANSMNQSMQSIYPILRNQTLTSAKLAQVVQHQMKYMKMLTSYRGDTALSQLAKQGFKVNSYATGSGALTSPELALIGDAREPEYVLLQSQIANIVEQNRGQQVDMSQVVNELRMLSEIVANQNLVIGDETIYLADQRVRNKQKSRNRG